LAGFTAIEADGGVMIAACEVSAGRGTAPYIVRDPDKLRHLDPGLVDRPKPAL